MAQGIQAGDAMAVLIGYHAPAGEEGVLAHTFSAHFTQVRLNGVPVSEAEVNGLYAASLGVPVGVLAGDDRICEIAAKAFPGVTTVEVKRAVGFTAADTVHPDTACARIEDSVARTTRLSDDLAVLAIPDQLTLAVDFAMPVDAELAATVPGTRRLGGRTLERDLANVDEVLSLIMAWYYLASVAVNLRARLYAPR
jgi:D-amino peptidase